MTDGRQEKEGGKKEGRGKEGRKGGREERKGVSEEGRREGKKEERERRKGGRVGTLTNRRMEIIKRPSTKDKLEKRGHQNTGSISDTSCSLSSPTPPLYRLSSGEDELRDGFLPRPWKHGFHPAGETCQHTGPWREALALGELLIDHGIPLAKPSSPGQQA